MRFYKVLLTIVLVSSLNLVYGQKFSYRQEIFISNDLTINAGVNLNVKHWNIYLYGGYYRSSPFVNGGDNYFRAGGYLIYDLATTGTTFTIMGHRDFTAKANYGYFLATQSLPKLPLSPTLMINTDGLCTVGIVGNIYDCKWLNISAWLHQGLTNGLPTLMEFDFVLKF